MTPEVRSLFSTALALTEQGDDAAAVRLIRRALERSAAVAHDFYSHSSVALRQNYMMAHADADDRARTAFTECPMLGRFRPSITPMQRATVRSLLDLHWQRWKSGETPAPRRASRYSAARPLPGLGVGVVTTQYINANPEYIDNDFSYHLPRSAAAAGLRARLVPADDISYDIPQKKWSECDLARGLERLETFLRDERLAAVVFDGNFVPTQRTIRPEHWRRLKQQYGFKLVTILPDCYDGVPDFARHWHAVSDLICVFHRLSTALESMPDAHKVVLLAPTLPYHEPTFTPAAAKRDIGFSYVGSGTRGRHYFALAASLSGLPSHLNLHERRRDAAPNMEEYSAIFRRSKTTFNNGWVNERTHIVTGRLGEAVLAGTLVFQEVGAPVEDFLVPFVHYVPVANAHQMVAYCQYFLEDEARRSRIADGARSYWLQQYGSARFWATVLDRLGLDAAALHVVAAA